VGSVENSNENYNNYRAELKNFSYFAIGEKEKVTEEREGKTILSEIKREELIIGIITLVILIIITLVSILIVRSKRTVSSLDIHKRWVERWNN